jgi:transposase InsO family protein
MKSSNPTAKKVSKTLRVLGDRTIAEHSQGFFKTGPGEHDEGDLFLGVRVPVKHSRGAPYHPMTQGKIERYHRSMKNVVKLEHYYFPWELENAIAEWVAHYNHERYHESLDNVTPADVYNGRRNDILDRRSMIKARTLTQRKVQNLRLAG